MTAAFSACPFLRQRRWLHRLLVSTGGARVRNVWSVLIAVPHSVVRVCRVGG